MSLSGFAGLRPRASQSRGFTLIELLVVVAIIAVLIAILLPSLGRARNSAKVASCSARLKQWGTAINMYAQQWDNWIMNKDPAGNTWVSVGGGAGWYSSELGTLQNQGSSATNRKRQFFCPAAQNKMEINYQMLIPVWPGNNYNVYSTGSTTTHGGCFRTSDFTGPGDTLLMADSDVNSGASISAINKELIVTSGNVKNTPKALDDRHMGFGNVVFLDSHAETVRWQDYLNNIPSVLPVPANEQYKRWTIVH
jgi:prepilin-type N-terminal cleavage/methylation domain-containing protein/prepilin-type processing-associated H-X9-DG protein